MLRTPWCFMDATFIMSPETILVCKNVNIPIHSHVLMHLFTVAKVRSSDGPVCTTFLFLHGFFFFFFQFYPFMPALLFILPCYVQFIYNLYRIFLIIEDLWVLPFSTALEGCASLHLTLSLSLNVTLHSFIHYIILPINLFVP